MPSARGANPLAVAAIDGNATDVDPVQQVVSQPGTIVAWNLHLGETEIVVEESRGIIDDEESQLRTTPQPSVQVFLYAVEVLWSVGSSILVGNPGTQDVSVILGGAEGAIGVEGKDSPGI